MEQPDLHVPEIDVAQAAARVQNALLLDVREDDEWVAGHAPTAQHMPMSSFDVAAVPHDRPVIAVCRSGNRSAHVTRALAAAGVEVVNMSGGMQAWQAAGFPMQSVDGSTPRVL